MSKLLKIITSILIAISIVINPFSVYTVKSSAAAEGTLIVGTLYLGYLVAGFLSNVIGEYGDDIGYFMEDTKEDFINTANYLSTKNDVIQANYTYSLGGKASFESVFVNPDSGLTGEELRIANAICDGINSRIASGESSAELILDYNPITGKYEMNANTYANLKEIVVNESIKDMYNTYAQNKGDLADSLEGSLPTYNFDFVGPQPEMSVPSLTGNSVLSVDGFELSPPTTLITLELNGSKYFYFPSEEAAKAAGCETATLIKTDESGQEYWSGSVSANCFGSGSYILYGGTVYYWERGKYTGSVYNSSVNLTGTRVENLGMWVSVDGVPLSSVYTGGSITTGAIFNTMGTVQAGVPTKSISESDFSTTVGGGSVSIPRTDEENTIGNAMELGLIDGNSTLTFDENGRIIAADDVQLLKLQELIDKIGEGNLQFEDVQEYLDLITQLIGAGNLTASQQKALLDNINANISSLTAVMTATDTVSDTTTDFSTLLVEHTGLLESQQIVSTALPCIAQTRTLVDNLFKYTQSNTAPPNFSFYWDSNDDGISEKYTLMDLSFMEQTLTNSNLSDKGRFQKSMTIREFVQGLIVLIVYSGFAIKLLRKLPGLFSSSESFSDSVSGHGK